MGEISRAALFGKLNSVGYKAIEAATVFCKLRGNPYVELAHWFHQLLQLQDSDLHRIMRQFNVEPARLTRDLTDALDRLPRASTSITDLSSHVEEAVERGWVYGSLMFGESQVRTGYLIVGILKTATLRHALLGLSSEFTKVKVEILSERFDQFVGDSPENALSASDGFQIASTPGDARGALAPSAMGKQDALKRFTVNLTEQARDGKLDPIVGRDEEIRQMVDILMRRRQNNPILTGDAGVGKTAVVEGFALRLVAGDVPPALKEVELRSLDIGLLPAGASMKGEFEQRLRQVIEDVQASPQPIILFIDEAHTLVGAGGAMGTSDAANLLKPALARGTLRTIAATTWGEYKKYIEKDPALTRRFQVVPVSEPSEAKAVSMMRGVASTMERHHQVQILDEALEASVKLSQRYIPTRQLPDKSVSLLDTACARVAVSLHAVPAEVDDSRRRIEALETELQIIAREHAVGIDTGIRQCSSETLLVEERARLTALECRWAEEKALVDELLAIRAELRENTGVADQPSSAVPRRELRETLVDLQSRLSALQGENPFILPTVDYQAVASVVADWTGIPVGRMARNELETVLNLDRHLSKRILGQDHALQMIAKRIQTSRAGLDDPNKPIGVFMLAGTSGVGKTETALALAEALYGGEQNVITLNMSEFQEAHTVSTLKGAPPGYVGYGEGGVLTEAVRRKPYSVVLLDEVEKAHPDVHEIFFQVFDKGVMEDGEGRVIDFKNTLILLTTNAGTELISHLCSEPNNVPDPGAIAKALRQPLLEIFPPALLGRLVTIPYYPLSDAMLKAITRLQLDRIKNRVEKTHRVAFDYEDEVVELIVSRCTETESGGRMIDTILTNTLLPDMSREFLTRLLDGKPMARVMIGERDNQLAYQFSDVGA
ncbi:MULTISPECIES: type VI secretion system ATPase TssH [unclassified Pseudomonas]|uniref:type VI secretion system ATPase TssH n=1 Tax=unclassified Pseudomonas TaxID=196821 RepID=UPI000D3A4F34|nr:MULTISPECIES: type VI secretion system ATPase TssH [unclassified Pseudomonas]RAU46037.1 type VI secretion system ATPase TssH [Pseudomonas sp. RIT 409]RAU53920.1 type VI secretion system ATPase TssH [Pseudomonas sp. RIT 412]